MNNRYKNTKFFAISFLAFTACNSPKESMQFPNIILISADDLGWSDIGCYGSEINTPNLDKLASEGMRFTQFHNTSKSFPSRASLLTGLYAQQNGYDKSFSNPIINAITLGEALQLSGYRTLWSGKHHGADNPVTRGFDRYYGLKDGACNHFNPGNQRPDEAVPARKGKKGKKRIREWCIDSTLYAPYTPEEKDFYTTDYFTNYALDWLAEYKDEEKPFFLYLAYTAPHDPLMAWPEEISKYEGKYDVGYDAIRTQRYKKQLEIGLIDSRYKLSEPAYQDWEHLSENNKADEIRKMEVYAAMIDRMDQNIGRLLTNLQELGEEDNTLIMFVSDNGASNEMVKVNDDYGEIGSMTKWTSLGQSWANVSNTPFRYYKNYSYEGGINTPFIAKWPGKIEANTFSEFPGHFIDFMATIVDIAEIKYPTEHNGETIIPYEGMSLLPAFGGRQIERQKPIFWEWKAGQAVYDNSWKIVKNGLNSPWDLYNLDSDPTETINLSEENPEKVKELEKLFEEWKGSLIRGDEF